MSNSTSLIMSGRKRKQLDLQSIFNSIIDTLAPLKAKLSDVKRALKSQEGIARELLAVAELAESFTQFKSKKASSLTELADALDHEGVNLWNTSTVFRPSERPEDLECDKLKVFAFARLAAFRLIEAGAEADPDIETLIRILQLANKTASSLVGCGDVAVAAAVLTSAAKLEGDLRKAEDPTGEFIVPKATAIVAYYSGRMEGAWKDGNEPVAFFMLSQGTDEKNLQHLSLSDLELLASKVLDIGKSILKSAVEVLETGQQLLSKSGKENPAKPSDGPSASGKRSITAIKWIQKALVLSERTAGNDTIGIPELKRAILRSLARAYYFSSSTDPTNLARAEATIAELMGALSSDPREANGEDSQQLRWMRLTVLKKKKAGEREFIDVFQGIIDHMKFNESNVTDVLQEIRLLSDSHALAVTILQLFLERALDSESSSGHPFVDRILLSLIYSSKSYQQDHQAVMRDLERGLNSVSSVPAFKLPRIPTIACQALLFQLGGGLFRQTAFNKAADYFLLCAHPTFNTMAASSYSKCFRKAALCYIRTGEYARASNVVSRCAENEAATHYLVFLSAAYQGLEEEAISAIHNMIKAPDFDRRMLLLATQLAHENQMKNLLLAILEGLLKTMKQGGTLGSEVEAITLVRCMIRIILELMKEPLAEIPNLVNLFLTHLQTANDLISAAISRKSAALIIKDISWLWRTTYNAGVQGLSTWGAEQLAEVFTASIKLMEAYSKVSVGGASDEVEQCTVMASFSAICGRVFTARHLEQPAEMANRILRDITSFRPLALRWTSSQPDNSRKDKVDALVNISYVFQVEQLCSISGWNVLEAVIQEASESASQIKLDTFEAIADLLWVNQACPTHVLYAALECILKSSLEQGLIACDKFSRWLRAITTILLSRNRASDRLKALAYIEQAVDVLKDNDGDDDQEYPQDERLWILTTSYNSAVESVQGSELDQAKRWFEAATMFARFVQNGEERAQQIEESYRTLLSRYAKRAG